ncbi:ABC transporter permease [Mycoplasma phocimorsus]|uniref:ABC transporter permease n=1 Tax=Mycoplasma phocimorsus TaxID=3045839 RepID=A0AAJ1PSF1_9MOLU|nr:ABC transporter permease [Mycoplasma phocimorsus]MDJ1645669.1 ABC transporter permease [Mycoplasma phocimorsus]MDJ1646191.1 ABC transporter permease [Mycoplasma phocimorsus]MDJ1646788.1 ABC transporter permease [Mycoplasma phocimorsus]MDJ1647763.1 ABC transporter permease [Mycoplasma phocimorsus]MDJ1648680.1 ABC transporter permease [Mycoplasma phocimorsus]
MDGIFRIIVPAVAFFCIISIASLSGLFSERVGIVNIAIEGMMVIGATFYGLFAQTFGISNPWMQLPLLLIASLATGLFALLHGFVTIKLKGDHIISGVALNLLAPAISIALLKLYGTANKFISSTQELALSTNNLTDINNIISLKLFLVIIIGIAVMIVLNKTKWGLRMRSIGENPQAADVVGISVSSYKWQGVFISGLLAGIAGGLFFQIRGSSFSGGVEGIGFLALAVLIMGQWKASLVFVFSIFFALIYSSSLTIAAGQGVFTPFKDYSSLINITPYVFTILILIFTSKNSKAPASVGQPYDKSKR